LAYNLAMPIALCLEDLSESPRASRFIRCVALRGGQPGLGMDPEGELCWGARPLLECELWVSMDDQLILRRPEGAGTVKVERAGRSIEAPFGKPVVLLDQDIFETQQRRMRVHVHGFTRAVSPPAPLLEPRSVTRLAATVAIGVAALGCSKVDGCTRSPLEIRDHPPEPAPLPPDDAAAALGPTDAPPEADGPEQLADPDAQSDAPSDSASDATEGGRPGAVKKHPPIEIRPRPPAPPPTDRNF
jgi:hypothetical protein